MGCLAMGFSILSIAAGYLDPEKRGDRTAKAITVEAFITDYLP
jgi:hypothetical protein